MATGIRLIVRFRTVLYTAGSMKLPVCSLPQQERHRQRAPFLHATFLTALSAAGILALPANLSGFVEVARGELLLHTTGRATYDSNIYAQKDGEEDFYFSFIPELQYLRKAGLGTIDLSAGVDFTRFADFTQENYEDVFAALDVSYPVVQGSPLSGGLTASYSENSGVNEYLNTRIQSETFSAGLNTVYRFSERLGFRNSLSYTQNKVDIFSDVESYAGTLGLQWAYSPALSFFSDYRLRRARSISPDELTGEEVNNLDQAIFVGATGTLMPRLRGTASVGFQNTDARGHGSDSNNFVTSAELEWAIQPVTDLTLGISRDLDISPSDQTVEATTISLGLDHRIEPKIELNGFVGFRDFRFRGGDSRRDETIQLGGGLTYDFTRYWNAGAQYDYTLNESNRGAADYRRHVARLFTRYSF